MELKKIILHQIIREDNTDAKLNLSSNLLSVSEMTEGFVEKIVKSYTSKRPSYGAFDEDIINNPFQTCVKDYFKNHDFLVFSKNAMNTLKKAINKPNTKGGYVVFAHYIEKTEDFIVTVMLDNSDRYVVNDNLDIEKLLGLDIDKVARANRINWQEWNNNKETYLSFIKGTRGVSDYFAKDFIGCTDYTSAKANADNLQSAVNGYMRENKFDDVEKRKTRQSLKEYTNKQIDKGEDIEISSVSAYINPDKPDDFINFVDNNTLKVGNFSSTRSSDFKGFEKRIIKGRNYTLEFQRNADNVIVERENNRIIIENIPDVDFKE